MQPTLARLLVSFALAGVLRPTAAQACSFRPPETELVRPSWPASSGLQLVSESFELDCAEANECRWHSIHIYERAEPGEPARARIQLPFYEYDSLTVLWGGEPVGIVVSEDEGVWGWLEDDGRQLAIQLEIEGEAVGADFHWRASSPCHFSALQIRHPFVSGHQLAGNTWFATSSAPTHVHVETDRGLVVEVDRVRQRIRRPLTFDAHEPHAISILERRGIMGGPFIAAGGAILDANPARGRIGWEHTFLYPHLFYSAALETDFIREFTFVPAVEISHGGGLGAIVIPRAGIGLGVPMQFLPDPRPGLRMQVSLSWFVFSILTTFDWLPVLPSTGAGVERPHMFKLAFLGQFSF